MLTSIVVPSVFNDAAVQRCVEAIKAQTVQDYELIIVDNGGEARGCVRGFNQGCAAARGDVLVMMNDDCVPMAGWLEPLLAKITAGVWLCSPQWQYARLGGHCLAMPRECYETVGGLDERYRHWCADHHLELQVVDLAKPICQVPASTVLHNPDDPLRIHYRKSAFVGNHEQLPNTGQWYLEDQAVFESIWGERRPADHYPQDWTQCS